MDDILFPRSVLKSMEKISLFLTFAVFYIESFITDLLMSRKRKLSHLIAKYHYLLSVRRRNYVKLKIKRKIVNIVSNYFCTVKISQNIILSVRFHA